MKHFIIIYFFYTLMMPLNAQTKCNSYFDLVEMGTKKYLAKEYKEAAIKLEEALEANSYFATQQLYYNLACCWSMVQNNNAAFAYLNKIVNNDSSIIRSWDDPVEFYDNLKNDKDFDNIKNDVRWSEMLIKAKENADNFTGNINKGLARRLSAIREKDQNLRLLLESLKKQKDRNLIKENEILQKIRDSDKENLIQIEDIYRTYGWPSPELVGFKNNQTFWLVIQHSDLKVQLKYLPLMKKAVKEKLALEKDLAYLSDRVLTRQNKPQIYGTQVKSIGAKNYLYPVDNINNANCLRINVGINESLENYLKGFNIEWDIEAIEKNYDFFKSKSDIHDTNFIKN